MVAQAYCSSPTGLTLLCTPCVLHLSLVRKKELVLLVLKMMKFRPTKFKFSVKVTQC